MFTKKKKKVVLSKTEMLQQQSANAIQGIRDIITNLKATNEEAGEVQAKNKERIAAIEQENKLLEAMKTTNAKIAGNFETLLS